MGVAYFGGASLSAGDMLPLSNGEAHLSMYREEEFGEWSRRRVPTLMPPQVYHNPSLVPSYFSHEVASFLGSCGGGYDNPAATVAIKPDSVLLFFRYAFPLA